MNLVIVESPTKQKSIARILGKEYLVRSTYGHIRDLPTNRLGVDVKNNFSPEYVLLPRAKKVVSELKKILASNPRVYLATDYDREGEAIAWHVATVLKIKPEDAYRITFHEITPPAIKEALKNPRAIDINLVNAQQARRILDRLVGYQLSPFLWRKVRCGLSAGRVQSVAVRLIVEREREINSFVSEDYFQIIGNFAFAKNPEQKIPAILFRLDEEKVEYQKVIPLFAQEYKITRTKFTAEKDVEELIKILQTGKYSVSKVEEKPLKRNPPPPYITSQLQQDASRYLYFSPPRTMAIAQQLYEGISLGPKERVGLITYHRTDSVYVSPLAISAARKYIEEKFGQKYLSEKVRHFRTKIKGAQEAHEAIRPTDVRRTPEDLKQYLTPEQFKLYQLIWKRFLASQMAQAEYKQLTVEISGKDFSGGSFSSATFRCRAQTLVFPGFKQLWEVSEENEAEKSPKNIFCPEEGSVLVVESFSSEKHTTPAPPRYNEASLIKALEENGIGRPSTYAPIVSTILARRYVQLQERKFRPTKLGLLVNDLLVNHFNFVVDLKFTARMEEELDEIASGNAQWHKVVAEIVQPLEVSLSRAKDIARQKVAVEVTGEKCPECGAVLVRREGRWGEFLACSQFPKCRYTARINSSGKVNPAPETTAEKCPRCGSSLLKRYNWRGQVFLACSRYPKCRYTRSSKDA